MPNLATVMKNEIVTAGRCNRSAPSTATFSAGSSGDMKSRIMVNGANVLQYNLYKDPARTTILGGIGGQGNSVTGNGVTGRPGATVSVYGLIPAWQVVATSTAPHTDPETITIAF